MVSTTNSYELNSSHSPTGRSSYRMTKPITNPSGYTSGDASTS